MVRRKALQLSGFVVNKASEVNFLSEANLWFTASRLNNSTITITFVVIYKLCATQQGGSVCVCVCVGGAVSLYLSMCVCVCLFHSLRVYLFCCQAVAVAAFKGCQPHCSLPSRQIASSPLSLLLPSPVLTAIVGGRNKLRLILCKYFMEVNREKTMLIAST